ncbi:MAG: flippase-like domain-containing protein, partial [Gammaproteobacteria bacterium]
MIGRRAPGSSVAGHGANLVATVRFLLSGRRVAVAAPLSLMAWMAQGVSLYLIVDALGYELTASTVVAIYCLSILAGAASFIPGGLGATEAAIVLLLSAAGVGQMDAITASLVSRSLTLWLMAGSGELLETCKTLARVWKIDDAVSFPGAVEHARVHELFAKACCFAQHSVTPSYGDAEGTPNTILEACAAGLPVVATRHAGIADVVVPEKTGLLVEELDVAGMAGAMLRMLDSAPFCKAFGGRARQHVRTHFSCEQHLTNLRQAVEFARTGNDSGINWL